jgi:SAM-dependent methyltransferase
MKLEQASDTFVRWRSWRMPSIFPEQWKANLDEEFGDACKWLTAARDGHTEARQDIAWRLDPAADFAQRPYLAEYLRVHARPGATVSILDVGAGAMTFLPKAWVTRAIRITAVDPLAERYAQILSTGKLVVPVPTIPGQAETLRSSFDENQFDAVFARNAFEQFQDPLLGLRQMLAVVKPGRSVLVLQEGMRDEAQQRRGPWVLREEDDELCMFIGEGRSIGLCDELGDAADVRVIRSWHWPWLLAGFQKK